MNALIKLATGFMFVALTAIHSNAQEIPSQENWQHSKQIVELSNGIKLAYVEMGNPSGKPTLLIHGFTDNSRSWSLIAPYLKDRRLLAIDLRGHGKSEAPECCYTVLDFAHDTSDFMTALKIDKADIIGHSLGSITGQVLAALHPERVNKLVLISSSIDAKSGPGSWLWDNIKALKAPIDPNGQFMMDWYSNPNPVDENYIARERNESAAVPVHVWNNVLNGLAITNLQKIAPAVKAPVQIIWGDQDGLFDKAHQNELKAAYPNAEFEVFEGAGHNMFWEFPESSAKVMLNFLER